MLHCEISPEDDAAVDAITTHAFWRLRDEVTQPLRTEQMWLLEQLGEEAVTGFQEASEGDPRETAPKPDSS